MRRRTVVLSLAAIASIDGAAALADDDAIKARAADLLASGPPIGERSLGRTDAPVVMVEYASATCPHCADFHREILPRLKTDYIETGKLRFIYREFPLDKVAMGASILVRCVPEDKFFLTLDVLFRRQKRWMSARVREELFRIMQLAGMDQATFDECLTRKDIIAGILTAATKARDKFEVRATPALFINGHRIDAHQGYAGIKAAIDAELAK